jgi:hypothetical protein
MYRHKLIVLGDAFDFLTRVRDRELLRSLVPAPNGEMADWDGEGGDLYTQETQEPERVTYRFYSYGSLQRGIEQIAERYSDLTFWHVSVEDEQYRHTTVYRDGTCVAEMGEEINE